MNELVAMDKAEHVKKCCRKYGHIPIFLEEKGDVLNDLGHSKEALQSYLAAKHAFRNITWQSLVEMKINNLAYV